MALPLSNAAAEDEDDLDTTGYAQLPADHLSDSSESSNGTSCTLAYDALAISTNSLHAMENSATFHNVDALQNSTPHQNDAYVAHIHDMEIPAAIHTEDVVTHVNDGTPYQNGRHVTQIDGAENQAVTEAFEHGSSFENGHRDMHADDGMENQGPGSNSDTLCGHVVHIDGMAIHVYGQLAGLQLSSHTVSNLDSGDGEEDIDDEDDVDERERQHAEDAAFQRAKEADNARRLAPLPPDRCQAIKNIMQTISLGDFRPEWANRVPEEQWINKLRRKPLSKSTES